MKKTLTALLALCMAVVLLVGCSASDTTAAPTLTETAPTEVEQVDNRRIELSGSADDEFVAEQYCYAESDRAFMYFAEGITVRGNMLNIAEQVMNDLEAYTGMSFDKDYEPTEYSDEVFYLETEIAQFRDVNADHEKINIYVVELGLAVPYAIDNNIVVDPMDFNYEETLWQSLYHELTHVLHMRNGMLLGTVLNEGFAIHTTCETMKSCKRPPWDMVQYFSGSFDKALLQEADAGFRYASEGKDPDYQYGIRFVTYLCEEYGSDVFPRILQNAEAEGLDSSYFRSIESYTDKKNDMLKAVIRKSTSDDVFDGFAKWYDKGWKAEEKEFWDYMESIGQGV